MIKSDFITYFSVLTLANVTFHVVLGFIIACMFKYSFVRPLIKLNSEIHNPAKLIKKFNKREMNFDKRESAEIVIKRLAITGKRPSEHEDLMQSDKIEKTKTKVASAVSINETAALSLVFRHFFLD